MSINWTDFRVEFLAQECVRRGLVAPPGAQKTDLVSLLKDVPTPYNAGAENKGEGAAAGSGESNILSQLMTRLSVQQEALLTVVQRGKASNVANIATTLPCFDGDKPEEYFGIFKRVAIAEGWSDLEKLNVAISKLTGEARSAFLSLPRMHTDTYSKLETALLKRFAHAPDYFRRGFRRMEKLNCESYLQFSYRLYDALVKWLCPHESLLSCPHFETVLNTLCLEQFYTVLTDDLKIAVMDRQMNNFSEAASLADSLLDIRTSVKTTPRIAAPVPNKSFFPRRLLNARNSDGQIICNNCQMPGHIARVCPSRRPVVRLLEDEPVPVGLAAVVNDQISGNERRQQ